VAFKNSFSDVRASFSTGNLLKIQMRNDEAICSGDYNGILGSYDNDIVIPVG
jgi:hypothetical protein